MRELKFRAWEVESQMYFDGTNLAIGLDGMLNSEGVDGMYARDNRNEHIIEQYTGIKDKNGKEIYEGDIVKVYYKQRLLGSYQLIWDNLNAVYELSKTNNYDDAEYVFGGANYRYCVIGNIHENPELLGDEK